jgi:hypothetical protein
VAHPFRRELGATPRRQREDLDRLLYGRFAGGHAYSQQAAEASSAMSYGTGSIFSDAAGFIAGAFTGGAILSTLMGPTGVLAGAVLGAAFHQDIGDAAIWFVRNVVDNPMIVSIVSVAAILARGVPVIGPALAYSTLAAYTGLRVVGDLSARVMSGDRMSMSDIKRVVLGAAANAPILSSIPEYARITNDCRKVEMFLDEGIDHFRSQCPGGLVTLDCLSHLRDQMPTPDQYSGADAQEVADKIRSLDPAGFAKAEALVQKYNGNEAGMLAAWQAGKIESIVPPEYRSQFMADYGALLASETTAVVPAAIQTVRQAMTDLFARPLGVPYHPSIAGPLVHLLPDTVEPVPASQVPPTTVAVSAPGSSFVRLKSPGTIGDEVFAFIQSLILSLERLLGIGGGP